MSHIQLYEFTDFKGACVTIEEDTPDLSVKGFLKRALSLKVHGDPWIVYSDVKYGHGHKGTFECFREGDYATLLSWENKISSVRVVKGGLSNPQITLYDYTDFGGKLVTLTKSENSLEKHGLVNNASSHKVTKGAWILYADKEFSGKKMITLIDDNISDYADLDWKNKVSSLKPLSAQKNTEQLDE